MKSALGPVRRRHRAGPRGRRALAGRPHRDAAGRRPQAARDAAVRRRAERRQRRSSSRSRSALERRVPMLGKAAETDARDVRAAAGYWRTDYAAIAPQHDANGVITETDPAILLLTANAAFRASQAAGDRLDTVRRLDTVVKSYAEVLKAPACGAGDRACDGRGDRRGVQLRVRDPHARHARQAARRRRRPRRAAKTAAKADDERPAGGPDAARPARRAAGGGRHEPVQDRHPEARRGAQGRAGRRQGRAEDSEGIGLRAEVLGAGSDLRSEI